MVKVVRPYRDAIIYVAGIDGAIPTQISWLHVVVPFLALLLECEHVWFVLYARLISVTLFVHTIGTSHF
jgi:hypothetical protein